MKIIYITIFLVVFNNLFLFANNKEQELLLSLFDKQGKERADCLNQLSKLMREDNPKDARIYINEALKLSRQLSYYQGEGQALLNLGVTESVLGHNTKAEETFNLALNIFQNKKDILGIVKARISLGHIQTITGNYKNALINLTLAYKMSKENKFEEEIALASMGLGQLYKEMNDYNKALEYLKISTKLNKGLNNNKNLVKSLNTIGNIYLSINEYDKSLGSFFEALSFIDTVNIKSLTETIYNNIGLTYSEKGNHDEALNYYFKSFTISNKIHDSLSISISYLNIGNEYSKLGVDEKATDFLNKSIEILKMINTPNELGFAYLVRGSYYKDNKSYKLSQSDLLKSLEIYKTLDLMYGQKDAYCLLSELYISSNMSSKANQAFQKYKKSNDSLITAERSKSVEITNDKIAALVEIEKLDSALNLEREKFNKLLFVVLSIIIFSVITIVFFFVRKRMNEKLSQKEHQLYYMKVNNKNLHETFATVVKDKMYLLGNSILESKDSANYRILKSSYDDVSHIISDVLVKYNVDFNSN